MVVSLEEFGREAIWRMLFPIGLFFRGLRHLVHRCFTFEQQFRRSCWQRSGVVGWSFSGLVYKRLG